MGLGAFLGGALLLLGWGWTFWLYAEQRRQNGELRALLAAEQSVREADIRAVRCELEAAKGQAQQQVAAALQDQLNTRQRWTIDVNERLQSETWLVVMAAQLEDHAIPIPPPAILLTRRRDESDYYPVLDARLTQLIRDALGEPEAWGAAHGGRAMIFAT